MNIKKHVAKIIGHNLRSRVTLYNKVHGEQKDKKKAVTWQLAPVEREDRRLCFKGNPGRFYRVGYHDAVSINDKNVFINCCRFALCMIQYYNANSIDILFTVHRKRKPLCANDNMLPCLNITIVILYNVQIQLCK